MYEVTYQGLHHWTRAMFEKLGWIVLAKSKGMDWKVTHYKKSLANLSKALEDKIKVTHDEDRKQDLKVLQDNVKVLVAHVSKDFGR